MSIFKSLPYPSVLEVHGQGAILEGYYNFNGSLTSTDISECLALGMALYLTDGLSRLQNNMFLLTNITSEVALSKISGQPVLSEVFMDINTKMAVAEIQDSSQYRLVNTSIYRYSYVCGVGGQSGDFMMIFAAAILLLHVLLALIHIAVVIYGGSRSNAWGKWGELLALAINSAPTSALQNTCAGIDKSETWSQVVRVREITDGHLELLFDPD
jgi:hypothetical protein